MLGALLLLLFGAFSMSTRVFSESTLRQSAEQQLKTIRILLERDLELTSFWLIKEDARTLGDGTSRDGVAMVGLSEWNDSSLFQSGTQRPAWNRQLVWYATEETPGRLIRQVVAPPPPAPSTYLNQPYEALADNRSNVSPESNHHVHSTRYLSAGVTDFKVTSKLSNATLEVKLHLQQKGNYRAQSMAKTENHLQVLWIFCPKNTWPPL